MTVQNPVGTDGFEFLEYATTDSESLTRQLTAMGFTPSQVHRNHKVTLFQQNNIRLILNTASPSMAADFVAKHGSSVSAMGFRVRDAKAALKRAIAEGARPYEPHKSEEIYPVPAIYGVGDSLIYFVDTVPGPVNYLSFFQKLAVDVSVAKVGLTYIDHVTHNLHRGHMDQWADFYERIFNFKEIRYFDISGKQTGLKSRAMTSPCGKIRIPLNESSDDQSQIEEFLQEYKGEGIQHIALGTEDIYNAVEALRAEGIQFLDTPDTYYEMVEQRLPQHTEDIERLQKNRILMDGTTQPESRILLQIFTKNMMGPIFYEIIQRKGDEGFGEGNFRALFESIELDQIRRGVLKPNSQK